jgi:hypothetical protein
MRPNSYRLLRGVILALGVLTVVTYTAGIPLYFRDLAGGCVVTGCGYDPFIQPTPDQIAALGLSVPLYSLLLVAIEAANALVFMAVGALLYWRAPANRVALLGAVCLVAIGATYSAPLKALAFAVPLFELPRALLSVLGDVSLYAFCCVFPTGHFVPRLMRYPLVAFGVLSLVLELASDAPMAQNIPLLLASVVIIAGFVISPALAQVYRYRFVSTPVERQQTKWVVFGVTVALVALVALIVANTFFEPRAVALWNLVFNLLYFGSLVLIPISLLSAILLSRLWAIDVIIRRTLIYGLLTAALAGLYLVAVVVLQALVVAISGEQRNTLVTVLSTLAIAALFNPLRAWLQRAVDRRFYRSRYSIGQTLARFGATLRDDVELDGLVTRLVHVVEETMQPEHVSLWLKGSQAVAAVPWSPDHRRGGLPARATRATAPKENTGV